jgi:uncharacterized membrane protein YgcG
VLRSRSKQQALMFLLGATLVGGALGFSADRVWQSRKKQTEHQQRWVGRDGMFDDLNFTPAQRAAWDAIADSTNCRVWAVMARMAPLRAELDSIQRAGRAQTRAVMTEDQRARWTARVQEFESANGRGGRGGRGANRGSPRDSQQRDGRQDGRGGPRGPGGASQSLTDRVDLCRSMLNAKQPDKP